MWTIAWPWCHSFPGCRRASSASCGCVSWSDAARRRLPPRWASARCRCPVCCRGAFPASGTGPKRRSQRYGAGVSRHPHHEERSPAVTGEPLLIGDPAQLEELIEHLVTVDRYALDTEFHRERTYWPQLALVQVAWAAGEAGPAGV